LVEPETARLHESQRGDRGNRLGHPRTRRELHDVLRALAAAGAIRRTGTGGSWDTRRRDGSAYTLALLARGR
jgi:hypothetical protein